MTANYIIGRNMQYLSNVIKKLRLPFLSAAPFPQLLFNGLAWLIVSLAPCFGTSFLLWYFRLFS